MFLAAGDGILVSPAAGPSLRAKAARDDFPLHLEFLCAGNGNSGATLRPSI